MEGDMPKKGTGINKDKSDIVRVRISPAERERCTKARLAGAHNEDAESSFLGFLVKLGIAKYEKAILPLEVATDEAVPTIAEVKKKKLS
ncbi:MAG: hypothetical protein LBI67_05535 [Treponema sp.]|jgi:hypothetical protein|nr:hypothetical protein [Treponema sp.]